MSGVTLPSLLRTECWHGAPAVVCMYGVLRTEHVNQNILGRVITNNYFFQYHFRLLLPSVPTVITGCD